MLHKQQLVQEFTPLLELRVAALCKSMLLPLQHYLFDNISVRLAEEDRSVNGNGLQVFGTVTKNPVATGADLVGYSGLGSK
jgi:hypothetical protein